MPSYIETASEHSVNPDFGSEHSQIAEQALEGYQDAEGHRDLQVFQVSDISNLKLARDGKMVLTPQPSDDPDDPLNRSFTKKYMVLASMVFASLVHQCKP